MFSGIYVRVPRKKCVGNWAITVGKVHFYKTRITSSSKFQAETRKKLIKKIRYCNLVS